MIEFNPNKLKIDWLYEDGKLYIGLYYANVLVSKMRFHQ